MERRLRRSLGLNAHHRCLRAAHAGTPSTLAGILLIKIYVCNGSHHKHAAYNDDDIGLFHFVFSCLLSVPNGTPIVFSRSRIAEARLYASDMRFTFAESRLSDALCRLSKSLVPWLYAVSVMSYVFCASSMLALRCATLALLCAILRR